MSHNSNVNVSNLEKVQCKICLGVGLIKTDPKICEMCEGIKCISCNSTGLEVMPYTECSACDGLGQLLKKVEQKYNPLLKS
jgi:DnaJ-class molecular chaperone